MKFRMPVETDLLVVYNILLVCSRIINSKKHSTIDDDYSKNGWERG